MYSREERCIKQPMGFKWKQKNTFIYSTFADNVFRYLISENDINTQQFGFLSPNRATPLPGKENPSQEV